MPSPTSATLIRTKHAWYLVVAASLVIAVACSVVPSQAQQASSAAVERGKVVYEANCQRCHGGATGGQMMDLPPPHNANGHTWHHPDCQLEDVVLNGSGEMGEMMRRMMGAEDAPRMPAFRGQLTDEEVAAILTYIKTWWTPEQREHQARITQELCTR